MKNIHLNKDLWLRAVGGSRRLVARIPYIVLIERFMMVRFILLAVVGMVALMAVISLLYLWGEGAETMSEGGAAQLNVDTIDQLELWLEERQTEREREIVTGAREYFRR